MKADSIHLVGTYGDVTRQITISLYWIDTYDLFVDNYLVGRILKRNGQWIGDFHNNTDYTFADVSIIADMIESREW